MDDQNPNTTNKPLLQENPYPFVQEEPAIKPYQYNNPQSTNQNYNVNQGVQPQVISQPNQNYPPQNYNVNQNYQPNQNYPPQNYQPNPQNYQPNQNFQPQPNQGQKPYQPPPYPYPVQNQGFMPAPPGQFRPVPPPPPIGQPALVSLPGSITPVHPKYAYIVQQCNMPCPVCQFRGSDFVSLTPGCAAISWSVCLFVFTGVCCFWIPLVVDGCKDIVVQCSRCRSVKAKVEKSCC